MPEVLDGWRRPGALGRPRLGEAPRPTRTTTIRLTEKQLAAAKKAAKKDFQTLHQWLRSLVATALDPNGQVVSY